MPSRRLPQPMRRMSIRQIPLHVVLIAGAVIMATPFAWQLLTSLKTFGESFEVPPTIFPRQLEPDNYAEVFRSVPFAQMLLTTMIVAVVRTTLSVLLCAMAAFAFARLRFPCRGPLFLLVLSVLMVPGELFVIPRYEIMVELDWLNTIQALIVPSLFAPFGVFLLRQFFLTLPRELEEAGRLDGANPPRLFWHIMLPLAKPGLIALSVIEILGSWRELLWPLIVNSDPAKMPVSAGLASLQGEEYSNYPVLMAGSLMAMLPIILLFVFMQRQFIQGIAFTGNKG